MPFGDGPGLVHGAVRPGGTILELGCGVGRITRPLIALGHPVVAVDDSPEMLEHVTGAEKVCADLFELRLDRRFDAVLAASHLIDAPQRDQRLALLEVCRRHVADDGVVLVERHELGWARNPADRDSELGLVAVEFRLVEQRGAVFDGAVTYRLGDQSWTQTFTSAAVEDEELIDAAAACGLQLDRWLDDARTWAVLVPRR